MKLIKIVVVSLFVFVANNLFATRQFSDIFIANGDTTVIFSSPLEQYFSRKGERTIGKIKMSGFCTALWRGYVATWKLENDSLFLIRVQADYCGNKPKDVNLKKEFGTRKVFANWVTDTLVCPQGELLFYVGSPFIHEGEKHYEFKQGKLISTKNINYLERNDTLIFPEEYFLEDTIRRLVLKSIDKVERDSIDENKTSTLVIRFNENREISDIDIWGEPENINEKIILRNAKEALKGFPKLMNVNYERYFIPDLKIFFNGYCLKFPNDSECDNE